VRIQPWSQPHQCVEGNTVHLATLVSVHCARPATGVTGARWDKDIYRAISMWEEEDGTHSNKHTHRDPPQVSSCNRPNTPTLTEFKHMYEHTHEEGKRLEEEKRKGKALRPLWRVDPTTTPQLRKHPLMSFSFVFFPHSEIAETPSPSTQPCVYTSPVPEYTERYSMQPRYLLIAVRDIHYRVIPCHFSKPWPTISDSPVIVSVVRNR
jgi:hypothetical protein